MLSRIHHGQYVSFALIAWLLLWPNSGVADAFPTFLDSEVCKGIVGVFGCARALESEWLEKIPQLVKRRDDELFVTLKDGRQLSWKSDPGEFETYADEHGRAYRKYLFVDYFEKAEFCMLQVAAYEGGSQMLLNLTTGKSTVLENIPIFNLDGSWFVVLEQDDYGAEIQTHGIAIWSLQKDSLKKVYDQKPERWPFIKPIWISRKEIKLEVVEDFLFKPLGKNPGDSIGRLVLEENDWMLLE